MLKQRLLTIAILLPLVLYWVFYAPLFVFAILLAFTFGLGIWEYQNLISLNKLYQRIFYFISFIVLIAGLMNWYPLPWIYDIALLTWIAALIAIIAYPKHTAWWANQTSLIIFGLLVFIPCWFAIIDIRTQHATNNHYLIMYLLLLVWTADTGAYFIGRLWGKHRLAPIVSPKKTIEGALGGIFFGLLLAWGAACFFLFLKKLK